MSTTRRGLLGLMLGLPFALRACEPRAETTFERFQRIKQVKWAEAKANMERVYYMGVPVECFPALDRDFTIYTDAAGLEAYKRALWA